MRPVAPPVHLSELMSCPPPPSRLLLIETQSWTWQHCKITFSSLFLTVPAITFHPSYPQLPPEITASVLLQTETTPSFQLFPYVQTDLPQLCPAPPQPSEPQCRPQHTGHSLTFSQHTPLEIFFALFNVHTTVACPLCVCGIRQADRQIV